jgi:uracil-DNA glycosylase
VTRSRGPSLAEALIPPDPTVETLAVAAASCTACDLYRNATQTVFGEGAATAEVMLVGEQPGDREDLEGQPFVGPAGRVLDEGLTAAGIERSRTYVTNAVKHFKWQPRGKARLHKSPNAAEQAACRPWLEAELAVVRPTLLVALGAVAAKSLFGNAFRVTAERGRFVESPLAPRAIATVHPSSILRADKADRDAAMAAFVADLRVAATAIGRP